MITPKSYKEPRACKFCKHSSCEYVGGSEINMYYCLFGGSLFELLRMHYQDQKALLVEPYGCCSEFEPK